MCVCVRLNTCMDFYGFVGVTLFVCVLCALHGFVYVFVRICVGLSMDLYRVLLVLYMFCDASYIFWYVLHGFAYVLHGSVCVL